MIALVPGGSACNFYFIIICSTVLNICTLGKYAGWCTFHCLWAVMTCLPRILHITCDSSNEVVVRTCDVHTVMYSVYVIRWYRVAMEKI